ncbi:hypothetical protein NEAUS04_0527 [Nematocida ausubeli]|uniref:Uncharacterized protein n=1 Tax=Nematocida ausubeli (strain ATCC PRA-371 / ERTm2) TaxID=1913371 RepID=A0A086IZ47_NEMA1|nr:uncharacterized protein NESG_02385 [Nematocida ausubeli]KAI5133680.1 hypothetical protein NEAUS06_0692 [Nematocida ausubeli]KAI5134168.1 hypothetical protein NEAUS07_0742 [Nematocida ausubeli]KAI5147352.1 hypothetical protein NEAUS05_0663 [Nematocida ausubeli]KAI5161437.1 hypothetical protein NEAUS04_0527 [Nematocida ausubeli]KFG25165.1 hypothetical protein NESG_02385 [Nematocida ausubeli]
MFLYDNSIDIKIPREHRDISQLIAAQNYQYMFAGGTDQDEFLIVDLMQPIPDVDLHIEDILGMNDVDGATVVSIQYTSTEFKRGIDTFLGKYRSSVRPVEVKKQPDMLDWMIAKVDGYISRNDGKVRLMHIYIGVTKYALSDIVLSLFKEGDVSAEKEAEIHEMMSTVKVLNSDIFITQ